ncbi:hypothetical protein HYT17_02265 [Candidatus Microgenomates bacterium]|nr:hypothetical protein [Candidatus Microgenomates bacterium]
MSRIIVTHMRPDLDAVGAVWAIKRFLAGWEEAKIQFVPAGERLQRLVSKRLASSYEKKQLNAKRYTLDAIEKIDDDEVIHVDTGLGPLDHHQTSDDNTCAAKRAWEFVVINAKSPIKNHPHGLEAGKRLMDIICEIDHFKEVTWPDAASDRYEITAPRILDGLKLMERDDDTKIMDFGLTLMDSLFHAFKNKVWAQEELKKGIVFETRFGQGIGIETLNDDVVHLSQRLGYKIVVRKDPRKAYVRIKASPLGIVNKESIDLTAVFNKLKEMDPAATWFLHVSKRMLLNGTTKNPKMRPTKLSLEEIIEVLKQI